MPPERGFYEALARGRTLVRYDRPGCGLSGPTTETPSMDLEVRTLEAVVAAATSSTGTTAVELFGASLGAAVAARFAATYPELGVAVGPCTAGGCAVATWPRPRTANTSSA